MQGEQDPEGDPGPGVSDLKRAGDSAPLRILSVDPPDGATGVAGDVSIAIEFNHPMARTATQRGYESSSSGLQPSEVELSWNADSTVLFVQPLEPLPYRTVSEPTDPPLRFEVGFSSAVSVDGLELPAAFFSSFSTSKRVGGQVFPDLEHSMYVAYENGTAEPIAMVKERGTDVCGALPYPASPGRLELEGYGQRVGLWFFALEELRDLSVQSVMLTLHVYERDDRGWVDSAGLSLDKLSSGPFDLGKAAEVAEENDLRTTSGGIPAEEIYDFGSYDFDVTSLVRADLGSGHEHSVFRAHFEGLSDEGDGDTICTVLEFRYTYLAP